MLNSPLNSQVSIRKTNHKTINKNFALHFIDFLDFHRQKRIKRAGNFPEFFAFFGHVHCEMVHLMPEGTEGRFMPCLPACQRREVTQRGARVKTSVLFTR